MTRPRFCPLAAMGLAAGLLDADIKSQSTLAATLVANDAVRAEWIDLTTNTIGASQTQPPGPLVAAQLESTFGAAYLSRYTCALTTTGGGFEFAATSFCHFLHAPYSGSTHADLTLTISGSGVASIGAELQHAGDYAIASAFAVDLGDDGTVELDVDCSCASPRHHRLWTWDFANGSLAIRIRTDQVTSGGAQLHGLTLRVEPWAAGATPAAAGCGGEASVATFSQFWRETTNYQLAPENSAQPGLWMSLRAVGYGDLGFLALSDRGTLTSLHLPGPSTGPCPALANSQLLLLAPVSARTSIPGHSRTPREWTLGVPLLPPGLQFFVQHGSVSTAPPLGFGTTNVLRIDT